MNNNTDFNVRDGAWRCQACPRNCRADRQAGAGFCRVPETPFVVAKAYRHLWEEPCISGSQGSGTIFFSGCNLACVFCQNAEISQGVKGYSLSAANLEKLCWLLAEQGAANLNLVTPDHYALSLIPVLRHLKLQGFPLPVVWNSNAYERVETLRQLEGLVDVYLPDLKYWDDRYAVAYSKAPAYFQYASSAIREMYRQTGPASPLNEQGLLTHGVLVRHLMLPGLFFDTRKLMDWLWHTFGSGIILSLMNQYVPLYHATDYKALQRPLSALEYEQMTTYVWQLGFRHCYIQDPVDPQANYTPDFDGQGVADLLLAASGPDQ
ncbi:radical SAM protein [Oscillospiraceae bacterium HV4-5-C5C]|nr:radical SAM protein [Oscillospiraceae bacterium HV4-5-C5C]